MNSFFKPARISPKEISGANGKFLPKPLLFHLRHPNSKTNQSKFWQILSPKNSFAKTSSALFRHLPEYLEGRTPKRKISFPFSEKIGRAQIRKVKKNFFFFFFFFFNGEEGRRDKVVNGVQTCALPISPKRKNVPCFSDLRATNFF